MKRWFAQMLLGFAVLSTFWLAQAPATSPGPAAEATSPVMVKRGSAGMGAFLPLLQAWQEEEPGAGRLLGLLARPRPGSASASALFDLVLRQPEEHRKRLANFPEMEKFRRGA